MSENGVCAVVVTFRPAEDIISNLSKLRSQVQGLVVVDNGSPTDSLIVLRRLSSEVGFELIENGQNLGIAAALNTGVRWAQSQTFSWTALFDQDSTVTEGFMDSMLADFAECSSQRNIKLIIPQYRDPVSGVERVCGLASDGGPFVTITSGSLFPTSTFERLGYFVEELFIYTVDDEYSLRIRSNGFSIGESKNAVLLHASGSPSTHRIFGKHFTTTNYRPGARYYVNRNRIWMFRHYGAKYPRWVRGAIRATIIDVLKIAVAEKSRLSKLVMILAGIRDGLLGRTGKRIEI